MSKFARSADEIAYGITLDGTADTAGDVQYRGHVSYVELSHADGIKILAAFIGEDDAMTPTFLLNSALPVAVMVEEDSQGFVTVSYFEDLITGQNEFDVARRYYEEGMPEEI